jgi:hypothetical protein
VKTLETGSRRMVARRAQRKEAETKTTARYPVSDMWRAVGGCLARMCCREDGSVEGDERWPGALLLSRRGTTGGSGVAAIVEGQRALCNAWTLRLVGGCRDRRGWSRRSQLGVRIGSGETQARGVGWQPRPASLDGVSRLGRDTHDWPPATQNGQGARRMPGLTGLTRRGTKAALLDAMRCARKQPARPATTPPTPSRSHTALYHHHHSSRHAHVGLAGHVWTTVDARAAPRREDDAQGPRGVAPIWLISPGGLFFMHLHIQYSPIPYSAIKSAPREKTPFGALLPLCEPGQSSTEPHPPRPPSATTNVQHTVQYGTPHHTLALPYHDGSIHHRARQHSSTAAAARVRGAACAISSIGLGKHPVVPETVLKRPTHMAMRVP